MTRTLPRRACGLFGSLFGYFFWRAVVLASLAESTAAEAVSDAWRSATPDLIASRMVHWHTAGLLDGVLITLIVIVCWRAGTYAYDTILEPMIGNP